MVSDSLALCVFSPFFSLFLRPSHFRNSYRVLSWVLLFCVRNGHRPTLLYISEISKITTFSSLELQNKMLKFLY